MSCETAPKVQDAPAETLLLANGASVYIIADVKKALPIIELLPIEEINSKQTRQMLEKTDFIMAAVFPKESAMWIQIAANGNYPALSGLAFTFNKNWKKQRAESGASYWYSKESGLSISMNSNQAFIVSSTEKNPLYPLTGIGDVTIPEGFAEFSRGYPVSCWLDDASPLINRIFNSEETPVQFPVQYIFINLYPVEPSDSQNQYEALIRLQFENASLSRGMTAIFNLAVASGLISTEKSIFASILFANQAVQNGRNLDIKTKRLTEEDIALLFEVFLLY